MGEVLGRVVAADLESPRGPDASHRIRVPRAWLKKGALVELELPRHLTCASCDGGGCDACDRSGAVTVRGRGDPADLVEVSLPLGTRDEVFVIRIPEHGGLPRVGSGVPRGHLLLKVEAAAQADPRVRLARRSIVPAHQVSATRPRAPAAERGGLWMVGGALLFGVLVVFWVLWTRW